MKENEKLIALMKSGWNRRIGHDFLSWMNDRVNSEVELWETGKRDAEQLFQDLNSEETSTQTVLDLGCGVGRIISHTKTYFARTIGMDISSEAIKKATAFFKEDKGLELLLGDGISLNPLEDNSIDLVYSFGVLCNMPVIACCSYLLEINRVLREGGKARLQFFFGKCNPTVCEDTVAFRSFDMKDGKKAFQAAGFDIEWIRELPVDVEIPDDNWLRPHICSLVKREDSCIEAVALEQILNPRGELSAPKDWPGSETEYHLTLLRAEELFKEGKESEAKDALRYARTHYSKSDPRIEKLMD